MRVVLVVGFYDHVLVHLQKAYSALLQSHAVMWVGIVGPHGDGDILNFRGLLFDRLALGLTEILVLTVVRRGREETYGRRIDEIVQRAKDRHPDATIKVKPFTFASAFLEVEKDIQGFLGLSTACEVSFPPLAELERWVAKNLSERLLILPPALHNAKNSAFDDPDLVYRSLKLLAEEYWELRVKGGPERKRKWHSALEDLGLTIAPSISKSRAGEQRGEYYVSYPVGSSPGNTRFLEQHLKKGNDRDERFCFRLYFFWDKTRRLVVVGWLPSHLETRAT